MQGFALWSTWTKPHTLGEVPLGARGSGVRSPGSRRPRGWLRLPPTRGEGAGMRP